MSRVDYLDLRGLVWLALSTAFSASSSTSPGAIRTAVFSFAALLCLVAAALNWWLSWRLKREEHR